MQRPSQITLIDVDVKEGFMKAIEKICDSLTDSLICNEGTKFSTLYKYLELAKIDMETIPQVDHKLC